MTITTADLPESLQKLFLEVEQTQQPLTVTHEGKAIVVIYPAEPPKPRPGFGFMKGQGEILGDIISPIEQPLEVLHRFIAATAIHYNLQLATMDQNLIATPSLQTIS